MRFRTISNHLASLSETLGHQSNSSAEDADFNMMASFPSTIAQMGVVTTLMFSSMIFARIAAIPLINTMADTLASHMDATLAELNCQIAQRTTCAFSMVLDQ